MLARQDLFGIYKETNVSQNSNAEKINFGMEAIVDVNRASFGLNLSAKNALIKHFLMD